MKRFIKPIVLAFCTMALATGAVTETEIDYTQVAEDIDIMAKIIDKTLEGRFPDEYKAHKAFIGFGESRGCQGIYLKGYGAFFMTRISFPVAERTAPQEEAAPDDLWQRTKYELRGTRSGVSSITFAEDGGNYDPKKVESLKEELLKLIGTYAHNIRQLGPQESIIIAVRGTSGPITEVSIEEKIMEEIEKETLEKLKGKVEPLKGELHASERSGVISVATIAPEPRVTAAPEPVVVAQRTAESIPNVVDIRVPTIPTTGSKVAAYVRISDKGVRSRTTLIIRVNKESAMEYKHGTLDLDGFMRQAEITQY